MEGFVELLGQTLSLPRFGLKLRHGVFRFPLIRRTVSGWPFHLDPEGSA
jgi:hypothetical protein